MSRLTWITAASPAKDSGSEILPTCRTCRACRMRHGSHLDGLECWIVDALQRRPHPTHSHLEQTLEWIARAAPKRAVLTNMHVDMDYEAIAAETPQNVEPAYDGMIILINQ